MNLETAREAKSLFVGHESQVAQSAAKKYNVKRDWNPKVVYLLELSVEALDTEDESVDPSFNIDTSIKPHSGHIVDNFCEEWVLDSIGKTELH